MASRPTRTRRAATSSVTLIAAANETPPIAPELRGNANTKQDPSPAGAGPRKPGRGKLATASPLAEPSTKARKKNSIASKHTSAGSVAEISSLAQAPLTEDPPLVPAPATTVKKPTTKSKNTSAPRKAPPRTSKKAAGNANPAAAPSTPGLEHGQSEPPKPRKRRSPQEIAAQKEAEESARRKAEELVDELDSQMMEIEDEDAREWADEQATTVYKLSDIPPSVPSILHPRSATKSDFGRLVEPEYEEIDVDVSYSDDSGSEVGVEVPAAEVDDADALRQRKIEQLEAELAKLQLKAGKKTTRKDKGATVDPASRYASGLRAGFTAPGNVGERTRIPAVLITELGGLTDEDLVDVRPKSSRKLQPQHRSNALVKIVEESTTNPASLASRHSTKSANARNLSASESVTPSPPGATSQLNGRHRRRNNSPSPLGRAAVQTTTPLTERAPFRVTTLRRGLSVSQEHLQGSFPGESVAPSVASNAQHRKITAGTATISDLPEFANINNAWRGVFLPTIAHALYTSTEPFKGFVVSSPKIVGIVQRVVNAVYPDVTYDVRATNEVIHFLAYARVNERRGKIAREAIDLLSKHVKNAFSNTKDAASWLRSAQRLDRGPLFFEHPTPDYCVVNRGHPDFIDPSGRLKSEFIKALVTKALQHSENHVSLSFGNSPPPIGLFAMVVTALERAISVVRADGSLHERIKPFSDEHFGAKLDVYVRSLQHIGQQQWDEIIGFCCPSQDETDSLAADLSLVDLERQNIFSFESPQKRRY